MPEFVVDILCYVTAFLAILLVKPHAYRLSIKIISEYIIATRMRKRASFDGKKKYVIESQESESIGLGQKGPTFGDNIIFNYLAEWNTELVEEMQQLLLQAGLRYGNALEEFMKSKFTAGIAIFFIIFITFSTNDFGIPFIAVIPISLILGILGGHRLTNLNMQYICEKRKASIENGVPDLIDLLVICTESGLDLNRSIRRIAREMRTSNPTMADELSLTSIELEMIPDHRQVFENFENRTDSLQIKTLSKTLSQSIEYGSPLAVSLRELAVESRQKRMLEAEARAAQAPTLLTLPLMFCIMPCLFIVMLGPVIVNMIRSFSGAS
ncbi:MAG: type II secretion system F family protein [Holosporaceae bacterium]|jgi:tight adherence protein C|nr:type II secretion system F family protein [Holosporaceae bacterium]